MMMNTGQSSLSPQITAYAVNQVWRMMLEKEIYARELDKLGLATGPEELVTALTGNNPHTLARQVFADPQTQQYSPAVALHDYRTRGMIPVEQPQFLLDLEDRVQLAHSVDN